jgi:hypothetical protein
VRVLCDAPPGLDVSFSTLGEFRDLFSRRWYSCGTHEPIGIDVQRDVTGFYLMPTADGGLTRGATLAVRFEVVDPPNDLFDPPDATPIEQDLTVHLGGWGGVGWQEIHFDASGARMHLVVATEAAALTYVWLDAP